jgi:hypothetical protein
MAVRKIPGLSKATKGFFFAGQTIKHRRLPFFPLPAGLAGNAVH